MLIVETFDHDRIRGAVTTALLERVEIELGYEGYLRRQEVEAAKLARADGVRVPDAIDYRGIPGLSNEVVEKLDLGALWSPPRPA